jgi:phytoene synthase
MQESQAITRKSASNLALAFILLPKPRRDGMVALYAFCRAVDDVADEDSVSVAERRAGLAAWRADVKLACSGGVPQFPVNRELQPFIQKFGLRFELFDELIRGCEMDLETTRYETAADLELYCYRVASVVGLLSIEIFGYTNPKCRDYAIALGQALQLTNILRDVQNDAARGRIYLPLADMRKFALTEAEILRGEYSVRYASLAAVVAERAQNYYQLARRTLPAEDRRAMVAAELMGSVYWRLFQKLEQREFNVFGPGLVRLSRPHKIALILRAWLRHLTGSTTSDYGAA